jgi:hypothetical protein
MSTSPQPPGTVLCSKRAVSVFLFGLIGTGLIVAVLAGQWLGWMLLAMVVFAAWSVLCCVVAWSTRLQIWLAPSTEIEDGVVVISVYFFGRCVYRRWYARMERLHIKREMVPGEDGDAFTLAGIGPDGFLMPMIGGGLQLLFNLGKGQLEDIRDQWMWHAGQGGPASGSPDA